MIESSLERMQGRAQGAGGKRLVRMRHGRKFLIIHLNRLGSVSRLGLAFGHDDGVPWRERVGGTGLVAVFLGLEGENCKYWGMAVRGTDLAVKQLLPDQVDDAPDEVVEHASAAFTLDGIIYQVPDLVALQRRVAASMDAA